MKSIFKITGLLLIALQLTGCGDDSKDKQDVMTAMLTSTTWSHAQVTHTDGDLSDQYTGFTITFTDAPSNGFDGAYLISNGGYAFSEVMGKWKFNGDQTAIMLDSEKEMDIQLDEAHLQLDFITTSPGGRLAGLSGHFVFNLQPL